MRKLPFVLVVVSLLLTVPLNVPTTGPLDGTFPVRAQASASTVTLANTTATWDAGTKASTSTISDTCENVTANHLRLNNSGNYQGIGLTTGSTNCPTGAWGVGTDILMFSYDMGTKVAGKLKDFSDNLNNGNIAGGITTGTCSFGACQVYTHVVGQYIRTTDVMGLSPSIYTFAVRYKMASATACVQPTQACTLISDNGSQSSTVGYYWTYIGLDGHTVVFQYTPGAKQLIIGNVTQDANEHTIIIWANWLSKTVQLIVDGVPQPMKAMPGALAPSDLNRPMIVGAYSPFNHVFNGSIDEAALWGRNWTDEERTSWVTDGRAQFRSTGTWTSPEQSTPGLVPSILTVQASGVTASRQLAYVEVLNATGGVIWNGTGYNPGGSNWYTFNIPHLSEALKGWGVKVGLIGDGTGTADLLSLSAFIVPPIPAGGGGPAWSLACAFNPLLVSWTCSDYTNYSGYVIFAVTWSYDRTPVAESQPNERVTFRAPGQSWVSNDADHTLNVTASTATGTWSYELPLRSTERVAWLIAVVLVVVVIGAALSFGHQATNRGVYFPPVANPSYRRSAVSVEEYPKGWRSYRQRDPDKYTRLRSVRRGNLWIVYGIRPSTSAEQERTGRKYIAEVQTVREKM